MEKNNIKRNKSEKTADEAQGIFIFILLAVLQQN